MDKTLSIFGLALKIAPYLMGYRPQSQKPQYDVLSEKDVALINLRNKKGSVIVILGSRDSGKTELAYRLAEFLGRPTFAISPQQRPPDWITWIKLEDIMEKIPPMSTLLMDDLPAYLSKWDYTEALTKTVERIIPMVRHERMPPEFPVGEVHLIFSSQSSAQADKYILDCDAAFLKPLGLLMDEVERPRIARIYRNQVDPLFEGKDDSFIQRHAFMMTRTYKGLIGVKKVT